MKQRAVVLAVLALAVIGLMVWLGAYAGLPLGMAVFANSSFTSQMFDVALAVMLAVVVLVGLLRLARPGAARAPFLTFMSWGGPLLGVLAGLREASIIWFTAQMTHVTLFKVVAPTVVEALVMPLIGLLAGCVAAAVLARPAKP